MEEHGEVDFIIYIFSLFILIQQYEDFTNNVTSVCGLSMHKEISHSILYSGPFDGWFWWKTGGRVS